MKYKYIGLIGIIGISIYMVGSLFKIESWPYASEMLILGVLFKFIALMMLIVKIFKDPIFNR
jgi:hypothetical protein